MDNKILDNSKMFIVELVGLSASLLVLLNLY
jgi:hypothetical protein